MMKFSFHFFLSFTIVLVLPFVCADTQAQDLTLHYNRPAEFFEEALVIGNGRLGGIVYGGTVRERISLNDITLWTGEPDTEVFAPEAYRNLPVVRELLDKGDYRGADAAQRKLQGHYSENYQPLGNLFIEYLDDKDAPVTDYSRSLDISQAIANTTFTRAGKCYNVSYFASAPDSVIIIRISADKPFSLRLSVDSPLPHATVTQGTSLVSDGYAAYHSYPEYTGVKEKHLYDPNRGIHYRTVVRASGDGTCEAEDARLILRNYKDATLIIANATSFNGFDKDPVKQGRDYKAVVQRIVEKAGRRRFAEIKADHVADFQQFFNRVSLHLGKTDAAISALPTDRQLWNYTEYNQHNPELEALYFQYGRYLLISSSRTSGVPANLQGLWNEKILPPWSSNYTSNINLEENYWHAETANLPEMHQAMLSFLKNLTHTGNVTAREYFGIDTGWCLAHNTDIWAMTCPVGEGGGDPNWANWNMGGAWTSTHIWEHYTFTHDREFLAEYYPTLKGAAEFCMKWLIEKDGHLLTSPSTSPENSYITENGYRGYTMYGGSADIAMIRECLIDAVKAADVLQRDRSFVAEARKVISRLLPYRIGKDGNLQEWYFDWRDSDPQHRHQSHLFGLYPGHQFESELPYQDYSTEELRKACLRTLEIKGDNTTGWSTGWRVNLYARLGDAANAYHIYRKLLKYITPDNYQGPDRRRGGGTYPNLLDAHTPFQIDGNFGGCAGVIEMIMQSTENSITLLPALPEQWREGSVRGICARGGFVVDMDWKDGQVVRATVHARKGGTTTLYYNKKKLTIKIPYNGKRTIEI